MKKIIFTIVMGLGLVFSSNGQALKVAADGKVGIGQGNPIATLHVKGSGAAFEPADGQATPTVNFQGVSPNARFQFQNYTNTNVSRSYFSMFGDDLTNPARSGELTFAGSYIRYFNGVTSGGANPFGLENMRLTSDGKLGVGFTSVGAPYKMAVNGSILADAFIVASDRRLKTDINEFKYGLKEVLQIKPYTYEYNGRVFDNDGMKFGVVAQEFEKIIPEAVQDFKYQKHDINNEVVEEATYKAVNTTAIQYMLVNAIKEQHAIIEEKELKLQELSQQVAEIQRKLDQVLNLVDELTTEGIKVGTIKSQVEIRGIDLASLDQNRPNPFHGQTIIEYQIPTNAKSAQLNFYNPNGQLVKTVTLNHTGQGEMTFKATEVPAGVYSYSLIVDGNQIITKQMILTN